MFRFLRNKRKIYQGEVVDLKYRFEVDERTAYDGIPTIYFGIYLHDTFTRIGDIDLRLKMNDYMYYYGHVGYNISPKYRGHNYSYYACKVLFELAKNKYNLDELYLTCNPDNIASYKILEKLNCLYVETVNIPTNHELYKKGDRNKCVFRYKIKL